MLRRNLSSYTLSNAVPVATGDQNLSHQRKLPSGLVCLVLPLAGIPSLPLAKGDDIRARLAISHCEQMKAHGKDKIYDIREQTDFLSRLCEKRYPLFRAIE